MGVAAVEVAELRVARGGRVVLDGLDLTVRRGAVTGLLGPSGSGKTTLMRAILGVQVVASGRVTVLGEAAGSPSLRSRVAYVTQAPSVYDDLTVEENLRYFARVLGLRGSKRTEAVDAAVERVELGDERGRLARNLSGGERSRVSLATALLGDPELLVLDEPTVGLDPVLRASLWTLFGALAADGVTLLVSSHVMDEAERCDRLVLMRDGQILADDRLPDLLARTGTSSAEHAFLSLVGGAEGGAEGGAR
ncbi:multidrug ABC transporter ATP-binding protein [Flavimobilis marinus]|uniref:ABC-2 type transport system ATP-binding protein n=1 Tax=Flavimobilis marinus TaxID=285351 RepID=A0A1I2I5J6_9MICO|nr:ABC transporter ATP-binding protein [Flavimobilis marinus]GHG48474.1 multidrug ABC transporter ATP-binding protein [Flavimobilis marinus]SFF35771.1 ABC-2 type transport system ATP-binding protein [Flavimobilis marinus]